MGFASIERRAVHDEDVVPPVAVEVEDRGAVAGSFQDVVLAVARDVRRGLTDVPFAGNVGVGTPRRTLTIVASAGQLPRQLSRVIMFREGPPPVRFPQ